MDKSKYFTLGFAPRTIQQLGIGLYNSLPPALMELITNSYDADATEVHISIDYKNRVIIIEDNGIGMTADEINANFLTVAIDRREKNNSDVSQLFKRKITGRKGLGKLSLFGIANTIRLETVKNNKLNSLEMDYKDISATSSNDYHPKIIDFNKESKRKSGTKITVSQIKQKNITKLETLHTSLARRFENYSDDFKVYLEEKGKKNNLILDSSSFFEFVKPKNTQFTYTFPKDFSTSEKQMQKYSILFKKGITGTVFLNATPIKASENGFYVLSRGKLASERSVSQFDNRSNDQFFSYTVGYFNIDYIDSQKDDFISTDRQSVLWPYDNTLIEIKQELKALISEIQYLWRSQRKRLKAKRAQNISNNDKRINKVLNSQYTNAKEKKIINFALDNALDLGISESKAKKFIQKNVLPLTVSEKIDTNKVYEKLIPSNFRIPDDVRNKIKYIYAEAIGIFTLYDNKDEKYIISEGLLLRALIDSSTTALLEDNEEAIRQLNFTEKVESSLLSNHQKLQKVPYEIKYKIMIDFLINEKEIPKKRYIPLTERIHDLTEDFNTLMHDSSNNGIDFTILKKWWDYVSPQLTLAYKYIK